MEGCQILERSGLSASDEIRVGMTAGMSARGARARMLTLVAASLTVCFGAQVALAHAAVAPTLEAEPEAKLTGGSEAGAGAKFGLGVALSADGKTALVGAPRANGLAGAAWVFTRSASGWAQLAPLQGPTGSEVAACVASEDGGEKEEGAEEPDECRFGRSVALASDANTALIGAPLAHGHAGAAWIFTRTGSAWSLSQVLSDPDPEYKSHFGAGVALSADGQRALVGAPGDRFYRGSAWVFTRSASGWSQQAGPLTGGGEAGQGRFGQNVALSGNGATAVIGAPSDAGSGAAWIFSASGSSWSEVGAKLSGSGLSSGASFGGSVALSSDGATALIGARASSENRGSAFVFAKTSGAWAEQGAPLEGSAEAGEEFGYGVALSANGNRALVGASGHESDTGAAWLYERAGGEWGAPLEQFEAGAGASASGRFGSSVALASGAETVLVGARRDSQSGAAWVFGSGPSVTSITPGRGPLAGGTAVTITGNNLSGASAVQFGALPAASFTVLSKHTITAVTPPGEGAVAVSVTTPFGTSEPGPQFTYVRSKSGQGTPPEVPTSATGITTIAPVVLTAPLGGVLGFNSTRGCVVRLLSRHIGVSSQARAALRLQVSGTGRCAGKLRLGVTRPVAKRRVVVKTIGTAVFSIAAGKTAAVTVKLNATGRRLLSAHRGRLNASLLLVKQSPAPALAQVARVRLARVTKRSTAHA